MDLKQVLNLNPFEIQPELQQKCLSFAMSQHQRLGMQSIIPQLSSDIILKIVNTATCESPFDDSNFSEL